MVALEQRYGPVCAIGVGPLRYLFLFGPDAHRELFAADIDRFSWREVTKSLIPVDGDTAIVVSDGDDHRRRRRVVQPAFSVRRLDGHLPLVAEEVSAAVGWTVWAALANAGVWERVRAEVGETALTAETLRSLTYLDGVVNESLRLWPPGVAGGRQVLEPFDALGIRIPAGPIALYSPYVTQRMPDLWPDPLAFRPERWDKDAPGYAEPAPLSFVPFGAGPRRCIGFALAIMEIKVVL